MNKDTSDVGTDVSGPLGLTIADKGVIMLLNNIIAFPQSVIAPQLQRPVSRSLCR